MLTHLFNKAVKFLKESYSPKLRKVLFVIFILGIAGTWMNSPSRIDERIAVRQAEVKTEYKTRTEEAVRLQQEAQRDYDQCKTTIDQSFSPKNYRACRALEFQLIGVQDSSPHSLEETMSADSKLQELELLKQRLESGYYYLVTVLYFVAIVIAILVTRVLLMLGKVSWRKARSVVIAWFSETEKMSSFQKYSLVLSALILIALIAMSFILLT